MKGKAIGMLQNYAVSKENYSNDYGVTDSGVHNVSGSCGGKLERTTQRSTVMDGMAGRRTDNFIRWCHRCKHEVPEYLKTDVCDLCGGEVVEIN